MIDIALSKLKQNTFYTFCLRMKELINSKITPEMGIDFFFSIFVGLFDKMAEAMGKAAISATDLARFDTLRDQMWIALRVHVRNYLKHPDLALKANTVLVEIDKHGSGIYRLPYADETAIIQNVCGVLDTRFLSDLEAMNADVWFSLLKDANASFESALRTYNEQKTADSDLEAASTIRPELEDAARKLITFLPMQAEVTGNQDLQNLVKELQVEAARF